MPFALSESDYAFGTFWLCERGCWFWAASSATTLAGLAAEEALQPCNSMTHVLCDVGLGMTTLPCHAPKRAVPELFPRNKSAALSVYNCSVYIGRALSYGAALAGEELELLRVRTQVTGWTG